MSLVRGAGAMTSRLCASARTPHAPAYMTHHVLVILFIGQDICCVICARMIWPETPFSAWSYLPDGRVVAAAHLQSCTYHHEPMTAACQPSFDVTSMQWHHQAARLAVSTMRSMLPGGSSVEEGNWECQQAGNTFGQAREPGEWRRGRGAGERGCIAAPEQGGHSGGWRWGGCWRSGIYTNVAPQGMA
jgi:hypothetical protein